MAKYFTYILRCADNTFYTGFTTDPEARVRVHNGEGRGGAKYTRSRRPVSLVYYEEYEQAHDARVRECEIKRLTRAEKEALISSRFLEK